MPPIYKVIISCLVVVFGVCAHIYKETISLEASIWQLVILVVITLIGLWSFPEPAKKDRK
jgi:hypothetical protein